MLMDIRNTQVCIPFVEKNLKLFFFFNYSECSHLNQNSLNLDLILGLRPILKDNYKLLRIYPSDVY